MAEKISITPEQFKKILPSICDKETSQDPDGWTPDNPLWGHCAVVSLVAQNLFGGELLRASLVGVKGFEHMRSHYWNRLADGTFEDFTKSQFGESYPTGLKAEVRDRVYVLSFPETMKRYKLLAYRLAKVLGGNSSIFEDAIYQKCFYAALDSPCQKMKFGCVLVRNGEEVGVYNNHFIEPLLFLCEPECIRLSLPSRVESMLGACGHAEEFAIWEAVRLGVPLHECDLYVAGIYPNGLSWLKEEAPDHTCLRCAVQMYYANLSNIFVPFVDRWVSLSSQEAVSRSIAYALGKKKV